MKRMDYEMPHHTNVTNVTIHTKWAQLSLINFGPVTSFSCRLYSVCVRVCDTLFWCDHTHGVTLVEWSHPAFIYMDSTLGGGGRLESQRRGKMCGLRERERGRRFGVMSHKIKDRISACTFHTCTASTINLTFLKSLRKVQAVIFAFCPQSQNCTVDCVLYSTII